MRMQKGICIEQKNGRSFFMLPNGQFVQGHPAGELEVGEEGYFYPHAAEKISARKIVWVPVLAAVAILAFLFSVLAPPEEAYAYVQVQINPGVELGLSEDGQIIAIRGLNNDGEKLAAKLKKWQNQPLNIVLEKIFTISVKTYTKEITITTVNENEAALPLETMVKKASAKTVEHDVKVLLKKASKAQWRKSIKDNVPVSRLVSHSSLVESEKPSLADSKKDKAKNVGASPKEKKKPYKERRNQPDAKAMQEKLKEPHSFNGTHKKLAPPQKKGSPKAEEKTRPKAPEKAVGQKEKKQKVDASPKAKKKKKEIPPKTKEKKKEASPKAKEKKKEKPKPDMKKKPAKKKKTKASQSGKKPSKQPRKSKNNKGKKE